MLLKNLYMHPLRRPPSTISLCRRGCAKLGDRTETVGSADPFAENLSRIISALFAVMTDSPSGRKAVYMLDEVCTLLFQPKLLMDEFERLKRGGDEAQTPIRDAFRHFMEMASTKRPHISKAVLCRIAVAWLGNYSEESTQMGAGLGAIPYRKDIAALLTHKEASRRSRRP
jgi:hypothetical protein